MTKEQWLHQHGITWADFEAALLLGIAEVRPTLGATVRSEPVLVVIASGPRRQDGACDFKTTFNIVASDGNSRIAGLFIQSYGDLAMRTRELTGRLLCNVIRVAGMLRLREITAAPRPANSIGHMEAGFLPIPASWDTLRARMLTYLRKEGCAAGEAGGVNAIKAVLESRESKSIRALLRSAGPPGRPGILWPNTCFALLGEMPGWSGSLDLDDNDTIGMHRRFCIGNCGGTNGGARS